MRRRWLRRRWRVRFAQRVALVALVGLCHACASERAAELPAVQTEPIAPEAPTGLIELHELNALNELTQWAQPTGPPDVEVMLLGAASTPLRSVSELAQRTSLLGPSGIRGARLRCEDASFRQMRRDESAALDFSGLDAFVAAHQSHGLRELLICLGTGAEGPVRRGALGSRGAVPDAKELDAYADWVGAVVERYDADGLRDMPGLVAPVRYYEIGIEFASRPEGAIEPYLILLGRAHQAAHAAYPEVVVAHAAWLLATDAGAEPPPRLRLLSRGERLRLLEHPEHFDALNLQVVTDAASLDAELAALRAELARRGLAKPILLSHLAPSPLVGWGRATSCDEDLGDLGLLVPPARAADRCGLAAHFQRLVAVDRDALAWTWRFAAAELVRKSVVAASHGVLAAFVGPLEDHAWWRESAFEAAAGLTAWSGLVDARAHSARPALVALMQLGEVLKGREKTVRVDMGRPEVRLYAFTGEPETVWVGWHQAPQLALPGAEPSSVEIEFELGASGLEVTPMALGAEPPPRQLAGQAAGQLAEPAAGQLAGQAAGRRARVALTQEPLYLRPARSRPQ